MARWFGSCTYSIPKVTLSHTPWLNQPQYGSRDAMQDLPKEQTNRDADFPPQPRIRHPGSRSE